MRVIIVTFLFFSFLNPHICRASNLTEKSVLKIIQKFEHYAKEKNVRGIANYIHSNAEIISYIEGENNRVIRQSKLEYLEMLKKVWSLYSEYEYNKLVFTVSLNGSQAIVISKFEESMSLKGDRFTGKSDQKVTFNMINGEPLIVKIETRSRLKLKN